MTKLTFAALLLTLVFFGLYIRLWYQRDVEPGDFVAFYSGAILWQQGQPAHDYNAACQIQIPLGAPQCFPFFHPPVLLPLLSAVSDEDYQASFRRWAAVVLVVVFLCLMPLYYLTDKDLLKAVAAIAFLPVFVGILQGQDTAFVLLGVLLFALFLHGGKDSLAGIALGLAVLRPHLAIAFAIPLLFARPKAFRSFFVTGLVLVAYSFALVGAEGFRDILASTILSAQGTDPSTNQGEMFNLVGILTRRGMSPVWAWPFFVGSIAGVSMLWRSRGVAEKTFALGITCALFTSPHLHTHDLAFLMIPLLAFPAIVLPLVSLGLLVAIEFGAGQLFMLFVMCALFATLLFRGGLRSEHTAAQFNFSTLRYVLYDKR